jgi:hypothetical protein
MADDNLERFRKVSGDLMTKRSSGTLGKSEQPVLVKTKSQQTLGQDARLDKFALWLKNVERESDKCSAMVSC